MNFLNTERTQETSQSRVRGALQTCILLHGFCASVSSVSRTLEAGWGCWPEPCALHFPLVEKRYSLGTQSHC